MNLKILLPIVCLFLTDLVQGQLSSAENYVYSKTYLDYNGNSATKSYETVKYYDGLGRPKQIINIKASPTGKDVVTVVEYDNFGRQAKDYLPVPQQGTQNGGIVANPLGNVMNTPYGNERIYSENQLESSPLDRILGKKQVGNAWDSKPSQFGYDVNRTGDKVRKFTTVTSWESNVTKTVLGEDLIYTDGQLYKNTFIDEDLNKTIKFKNGKNQIIMTRKVISDTENADTYYIYNEYDQLALIIPPLASIRGDIVSNTNKQYELCYHYKYDNKNRLVEKKLPGKGWEYMVYNKADQLILTQDTVLKGKGQWIFTKYDQLGRPIYTGITNNTASRASMQNSANANANLYETRTAAAGFTLNGMAVYYTKLSTPSNVSQILSVNYYDTYPSYDFNPPFPTNILGILPLTDVSNTSGLSTKSLPVVSLVKNIEDDNWTKDYTYFDGKARVIGKYSINHLGGRTKIDSKLDFAGVVQQTVTRHRRLDTDTDRVITENFTYDTQNRLLTHTHQIDSNPVEYLTQNTYNELSQITNKKVGGMLVTNPLQDITYKYNIRGWLTKINDPANLNGKLFGYEIRYNNPISSSIAPGRFNGNIAEVDWANLQDGILKRYNYDYDNLNRLKKGIYSEPNNSIPQNNYYNESINYDFNGNIISLKRNRKLDNVGVQLMDDLSYNYIGNQLNTVIDSSSNYFGYPDISGNIIHYDNNGNMIDHVDKGILEIKYNNLNLPSYIKFDQYVQRNDPFGLGLETKYKNTTYNYRADGVKIKKVHNYFAGRTQMDASTTTEYFDEFQYNSETGLNGSSVISLQFVPTLDGYFDFVQNKYIYQYKDHLGNIRLAYYKDTNGNAKVDRKNDYYPFGLEFGDNLDIAGSISANYTYGYQEQEKQLDTGWDSFKWRNYDSSLGRFFNIDPLSENFPYNSTYAFQENKLGLGREYEGLELVPFEFIVISNSSIEPAIPFVEQIKETPIEAITLTGRATPPPELSIFERIWNGTKNFVNDLFGNNKSNPSQTVDKVAENAKPEKVEPENVGNYRLRPDQERALPKKGKGSGSGEPLADEEALGSEHTQLGRAKGRNGDYNQAREFDKDGKPVRDIDFTDHGRPATHPDNPHVHRWLPNKTGGTLTRSKNPEPLIIP